MTKLNLHQEEYTNVLIRYSDTIINYFPSKIENNIFIIKEENKIKKEKLYIEKKEKYYPLIINLPVYNVLSNKMDQMGFVPYLIYDDILNCFSYN